MKYLIFLIFGFVLVDVVNNLIKEGMHRPGVMLKMATDDTRTRWCYDAIRVLHVSKEWINCFLFIHLVVALYTILNNERKVLREIAHKCARLFVF